MYYNKNFTNLKSFNYGLSESYLKKSSFFNIKMSRRNKILHNLPDIDDDDKLYYAADASTDKYYAKAIRDDKPRDFSLNDKIVFLNKDNMKVQDNKVQTQIQDNKVQTQIQDNKVQDNKVQAQVIDKVQDKQHVIEVKQPEIKTVDTTVEKPDVKITANLSEIVSALPIVDEKKSVFTEEQLLFNLKIISELKKDDKLSYYDNQFIINDPGYKQGIYRWYYKQDRANTLKNINILVDATFSYIDETFNKELSGGRYREYKTERVLYENNSQKLQRFKEALLDTCRGLDKLRGTYQELDDRSMTSGIELIVEKIKVRTDKINKIMKISV